MCDPFVQTQSGELIFFWSSQQIFHCESSYHSGVGTNIRPAPFTFTKTPPTHFRQCRSKLHIIRRNLYEIHPHSKYFSVARLACGFIIDLSVICKCRSVKVALTARRRRLVMGRYALCNLFINTNK